MNHISSFGFARGFAFIVSFAVLVRLRDLNGRLGREFATLGY